MANLLSIARPYARAAFECAREKQALDAWKAFLDAAASAIKQPMVTKLLARSEASIKHKLSDAIIEVLSPLLDTERKNFLLLLIENDRLIVLPDISALFTTYYDAFEKMSTVRVVTAIDVSDDYKQELANALSKRTQTKVTLNCELDPAILGGAIVHLGDKVIDASIRGQLTRLLEFSLR